MCIRVHTLTNTNFLTHVPIHTSVYIYTGRHFLNSAIKDGHETHMYIHTSTYIYKHVQIYTHAHVYRKTCFKTRDQKRSRAICIYKIRVRACISIYKYMHMPTYTGRHVSNSAVTHDQERTHSRTTFHIPSRSQQRTEPSLLRQMVCGYRSLTQIEQNPSSIQHVQVVCVWGWHFTAGLRASFYECSERGARARVTLAAQPALHSQDDA